MKLDPFKHKRKRKTFLKKLKKFKTDSIKNLCEHKEKENYYKSVRVSIFWSSNFMESRSNGDKNKTLSVEDYLNKIRRYLKDIKYSF